MKKNVIIIIICSLITIASLTVGIVAVVQKNDAISLDKDGFYVVSAGEPVKVNIDQLSEEELALPTEELIDTIMNSQYMLFNVYFNSNIVTPSTSSYERWKKNFNGLAELANRSDACKCLYDYFMEQNPEGYQKDKASYSNWCLRSILLSDDYKAQLSDEMLKNING